MKDNVLISKTCLTWKLKSVCVCVCVCMG